jgi:hypothetical protein
VESVGAIQQVQHAPAVAGIDIIVKQVNGGTIYICTNNNGAGWVISAATVSQAKGPRILTASRTGFDVYLYSLNFPNDNLLADSCSTGGQYPTPGAGDPYWCTSGGCVQSPLQPAGAYGGPYSTSGACATACAGLTPPNPPYWCVSQVCVQSSTPPEGYTGGPFASLALCQASLCEEAPFEGTMPQEIMNSNMPVPYIDEQLTDIKVVNKITNEQMNRIKLPCIHRSERLASGFT